MSQVFNKATTTDVSTGTDNTRYLTSYLVESFYVPYSFDDTGNLAGATRGCGIYSDGTIKWGSNATSGNARGTLTWDTNKAVVSSPIEVSLQASYVTITAVTTICVGTVIFVPENASTLSINGQLSIDRVSNTQVRIKLRGDDGTNRSVILTLS